MTLTEIDILDVPDALADHDVRDPMPDEWLGDSAPRPTGCLCQWEQGDSPCPVHPSDDDLECQGHDESPAQGGYPSTVYCDGSCRRLARASKREVFEDFGDEGDPSPMCNCGECTKGNYTCIRKD